MRMSGNIFKELIQGRHKLSHKHWICNKSYCFFFVCQEQPLSLPVSNAVWPAWCLNGKTLELPSKNTFFRENAGWGECVSLHGSEKAPVKTQVSWSLKSPVGIPEKILLKVKKMFLPPKSIVLVLNLVHQGTAHAPCSLELTALSFHLNLWVS